MKQLSSPDPLDGLGKADIVGLELVKADADEDSEDSQEPVGGGSDGWDAVCGEVIDDA